MTVLQNYIAGEFVASTGTQLVDVMNPATEEVVAQMPVGLAADVDAAYSAAVAAKAHVPNRPARVRNRITVCFINSQSILWR